MPNENEWVSGQVTLSLNNMRIEMEMTVPATPVKPMRMLPIFQAMTSSFVDAGIEEIAARGEKISCRAGCGACCRQAVPLAETEVYQIAALVEKMDEPQRRRIQEKFDEGCRRFQAIDWFERMEKYPDLSLDERREVVMDYFHQGVACPFLEDESCSIHAARPLACREYLVTSPAENCSAPSAETVRLVKLMAEPSKILRETARSENLKNLNFVPLIRALEWARLYPEKMPEKKGTEWVTDFVNKLTEDRTENEKS